MNQDDPFGEDARQAARFYLAQGLAPIPVPAGTKAPVTRNWQHLHVSTDEVDRYFESSSNVGILLGDGSQGLIDIDLDCKEAQQLAPYVLPETNCRFGRTSRPHGHYLYQVDSTLSTSRFRDLEDGAMLLELRSTGCQTIFPPSKHPSGETIEFVQNQYQPPSQVESADLLNQVKMLAALTLMAKHWPSNGSRQDTAMALAGGLLRSGVDSQRVERIIRAVAWAAGDDEVPKRKTVVAATKARLEQGKSARGWPSLARRIGPEVVNKFREWLGCNGAGGQEDDLENARASVHDALEQAKDGEIRHAFDVISSLVKLPLLEYALAKSEFKSVLDKKLNLNDFEKAVSEERRRISQSQRVSGGSRPEIVVNDRQLRSITYDCLIALEKWNDPPELFVRSGRLVRLGVDEDNRPRIEVVNDASLRGMLSRAADFFRITKDGPQAVSPPPEAVRNVLSRGKWPFQPLQGFVETPVLRGNGSLLLDPGYDQVTQLIYQPHPSLKIPPISEHPTKVEVSEALSLLLDEAFGDFPFDSPASKANLLGLHLTHFLRPAIKGPVPMALIDAPDRGTGKGLLVEVVTRVGTGRAAGVTVAPQNEDEWRKKITSILLAGMTFICIDNVAHILQSESLCSALTEEVWSDRILGISEMVDLPIRATWMATGNNLQVGGDMPRRCYRIRLDAQTARPWTRRDFKHPKLALWVSQNRGALVAASLTLCRAWFAAECPSASVPTLGRYEAWTESVGGVLATAGVQGFLENLDQFYEEADDDRAEWGTFFEHWYLNFSDQLTAVAKVRSSIEKGHGIPTLTFNTLPAELDDAYLQKRASFHKCLGRALAQKVGIRFGSFHLQRAGKDKRSRTVLWRVVKV